jgi:hypothetical protein
MGPIPSSQYPFAEKMWELNAQNSTIMLTSTMEGGSAFMEALNGTYFFAGAASGLIGFVMLSLFGLPTLLVFGLVRGLGENSPGALIFQCMGALVGHFYFRKKFGAQTWLKYAPVILAGCACGQGLVSMLCVGFVILTKMVSPLIY